jgi:hypothetical protein
MSLALTKAMKYLAVSKQRNIMIFGSNPTENPPLCLLLRAGFLFVLSLHPLNPMSADGYGMGRLHGQGADSRTMLRQTRGCSELPETRCPFPALLSGAIVVR